MFENYKLRKYANDIIGFAYEQSFCNIKTFLVIKRGEDISFIPYKEVFLGTKSEAGNYITELKGQGYKTLNDYVQDNKNCKKLCLRRIENPISKESRPPRK